MGAAALVADLGSVCVPLAVGSALGSACASTQDRCGHRVCALEAASWDPAKCAAAACAVAEQTFAVMGVVHDAEVMQGVIGVFTDNEPVIGVRARTLPYTQAIGKERSPRGSKGAHLHILGAHLGALHDAVRGIRSDTPTGENSEMRSYAFGDLLFILPGMSIRDDVVISFGTRTVVRLPLWGASNAPLDFDVLGTVKMPLDRLLQSSQPVTVSVPIQPRGESLTQVARVSLTFGIAPAAIAGGNGYGRQLPDVFGESTFSGSALTPASVASSDTDEVGREIRAQDTHLYLPRKKPWQEQDEYRPSQFYAV